MTGKMIFVAACIAVILVSKVLIALINRRRRSSPQQAGPLVPAQQAARRACCLAAVVKRGEMECLFVAGRALAEVDPSKASEARRMMDGSRDGLNGWLHREGLWDALSPAERKSLSRGAGWWSEQDAIDASWRREALGAIAWAIGIIPALPAWDTSFGEDLPKMVGKDRSLAWVLQRLSPRSEGEIRRARDMAELWLWRARTTRLMREKPDAPMPPGMTFEKIIRLACEKAKQEGVFEPVEDDFPALGKAYRALTDEEWGTMRSIASERLHAFNWLCGYAASWDDVRCDT